MAIVNNFKSVFNKAPVLYLKQNKPNLNLFAKCSTSAYLHYDKDPGPQFTNPEIQKLLKSITRINVDKVFRKRSVSDNSIEYKFMTTEQLENQFRKIAQKVEGTLQMPPVVKVKEDADKIISKDTALKGFSETKIVFTDITYGINPSNRKVVIRHPNGNLEYAPQDVRKRMNQLYFPLAGRDFTAPKMFEQEHLQRCLREHKYEFILDRLCAQYEPTEKAFHEISSQVYMHINENKKFDDLRSTRHFGPMAFFLAWHKTIDDLLYDMIKRDYLKNGVEIISLMYKLNEINFDPSIPQKIANLPERNEVLENLMKSIKSRSDDIHEEIKTAIGKSREDFEIDDLCLEFIEDFVKNYALKKVPLELAIQAFKEINDEKRKLYEGLRKAHGVN